MTKDINLLPSKVIKQRKSRERTNIIILLSILVVVTAFSLMLIPLNEMLSLEGRKNYLQQSMPGLQVVLENEKKLAVEQEKVKLRRNVLSAIEAQDVNILNIIEKTEGIIPEDLFFLSLAVSGGNVNITGVARSEVDVADFIRSMRQLGLFDKVFVASVKGNRTSSKTDIDDSNGSSYQFNMKCTLKAGKGN